jgi:hypothetical protein
MKRRFFNKIIFCFSASFSTQSIWWHYMIITVPKTLKRPKNAFLLIGAGNNNNP